MMSTASARAQPSSSDSITVNGVTYHRSANVTHLDRVHSAGIDDPAPGALVDGGANGGLLGDDAIVLDTDLVATADVVGVTNDVLPSLPIVQGAAKIETILDGPVIGIFSSYCKAI